MLQGARDINTLKSLPSIQFEGEEERTDKVCFLESLVVADISGNR